ncbi:hypothetical protein [Microbacterium sp. CR_7]|uniref:hypothetical protein n=1 Tax=Microbacterium sp. CR_7 TaxID=3055792 RepID=UPI0035C085AD
MPRPRRESPADLVDGWPAGEASTPEAEVARLIVLDLRAGIAEHGVRGFAELVGMNHATLLAVSAGRTWPSLQLIVGMERALGRAVWPRPV